MKSRKVYPGLNRPLPKAGCIRWYSWQGLLWSEWRPAPVPQQLPTGIRAEEVGRGAGSTIHHYKCHWTRQGIPRRSRQHEGAERPVTRGQTAAGQKRYRRPPSRAGKPAVWSRWRSAPAECGPREVGTPLQAVEQLQKTPGEFRGVLVRPVGRMAQDILG